MKCQKKMHKFSDESSKQLTMLDFSKNSVSMTFPTKYTKTNIRNALVLMVLRYNFSINSLCDDGFKKWTAMLNSMAANDIPSRQTIWRLVAEEYLKQMKVNDKILQNSPSKIALIVDGWTSLAVNGYFAIMASFLYKKQGVTAVTQHLCLIPCIGHGANNIAQEIVWHVFTPEGMGLISPGANLDPRKISAFVCDDASVNTCIINYLNDFIKTRFKDEVCSDREILPVYCMAQVIHRVVVVMLNFAHKP
jgi:hypothetical protein